jgi:single-strand DNA-binding protein
MADTTTIITGNLTEDPELRFTPNGVAVAGLRVAVTSRVKDGDAWKDGDTSYFRVNVWRTLAEHTADSLTKGDRVIVVGRLKTRSWETPEGDKRTVVEVEADEIGPSLLGHRQARTRHQRRQAEGGRAVQRRTAVLTLGHHQLEQARERRDRSRAVASHPGGPRNGTVRPAVRRPRRRPGRRRLHRHGRRLAGTHPAHHRPRLQPQHRRRLQPRWPAQ